MCTEISHLASFTSADPVSLINRDRQPSISIQTTDLKMYYYLPFIFTFRSKSIANGHSAESIRCCRKTFNKFNF